MEIKDLKGLSIQELQDKLNELSKQLMELHFKRRSNVEKPHLFNKIKKDIARIHTVINQK